MKADIGVLEKNKKQVAAILNTILADETVLYVKTRNYHWNVVGPNFYGLHNLFEVQYGEIAIIIDQVAERVRQLGHHATGSMAKYLKNANLKESAEEDLSEKVMLQNLVLDHEELVRGMRDSIDEVEEKLEDAATADFITALVEQHEKMVWMLRSSIGK